jgi:ribosomal protein S18 acetylase RimI-like enzyme
VFSVAQERDTTPHRRLLEALTARLPQWFAQAESNRHYAEQAEKLEAWIARLDGQAVGMLLLKNHSATSAEIYWLGVDPSYHRQGIGRALIDALEHRLREEKARFLFVTTLHPDVDYEPYQRTRSFYESMGFELALSSAQGRLGPSSDPLACYLKLL